MRKIAVVGGGWAGCAAAVELVRQGQSVTLFEAARTLGGRARMVEINGHRLDNGQHILLGAYSETLRLMQTVGIDTRNAFLRLPLQMHYPPASDGMDFVAARMPAPLHVLSGMLRARGLTRHDKLSLARFSTTARWMGWQLHTDCSVSELLDRFDQTDRLIRLMWRPLCIAALNTPPEHASAQVFLNVLRDSLGGRRAASDMLLPRVDLSSLFPQRAAAFVEQHGGTVRCGAAVKGITCDGVHWQVTYGGNCENFDGVVVATHPSQVAALLSRQQGITQSQFEYEPITTCYLQYADEIRLPHPFYALIDNPDAQEWGQFVFDRGWLDLAHTGILAVVVSAAAVAAEAGRNVLAAAITAQLACAFRRPELAKPEWCSVITEKRATYSCRPALSRPENATGLPGLAIAGDYTACDYPATLESSIRSGVLAARCI